MKPQNIESGKSYHNGKEGVRSYSERRVIELNAVTLWNGSSITDGVRYQQTKGPYNGKTFVMPLHSFARWAKAEV